MSDPPSTPDNDTTQTSTGTSHLIAEGRLLAGRYRVGEVLGIGAAGMVYKVRDETLDLDVALKVLRADRGGDTLQRFHRELVLARQVSHRNVVRIHDIGRDGEIHFLTMDLVEGRSLKELIAEAGRLPLARALDIARQLAQGLAAAHEIGVVHRDLKPANVLVDKQNTAYITDFGVARSTDSAVLTRTGFIVGTPDYLSPEQARGGKLDGRSDIYSLGLILFEMISGELPFSGETYEEVLAQRTVGTPRDLTELGIEVPASVQRILDNCLARDPQDRYANAAELAEDLGNDGASSRSRRRGGYGGALAAGLGAVLIASIAGGWWWYTTTAVETPAAETAAVRSAVTVALFPFRDETGRPELAWLRTGLPELAADQLVQTANLRVVDPNRVLQTLSDLKMIERPGSAAELRQAAELLGAQRIVSGTVRAAGELVRVDAAVTDVSGDAGEDREFSVAAPGGQEVFQLIDRFTGALSEALAVGRADSAADSLLSDSQPALRDYAEGVRHLYLGNSLEAAPLLERAVGHDAGFAAAWLRLSQAYEALGFGEKSIDAIEQASELLASSDSRIALEVRARKAILSGDLATAQATLETITRRYPADSEARVALALAHEDEGELTDARAALEQVLREDPNHPRAWFLMGKYAILTGDVQVAIDEYLVRALVIQNRLGNQQGRADALNAMGIAFHRLGQLPEAEEHYRQAAQIRNEIGDRRGSASSRTNLARILVARGEFEAARAAFFEAMAVREAIGDRPGQAVLLNELGLLEESQGDYEQALARFREALQIRRALGDKRALTESYSNVGFAYFTLGEYDNAAVYWEQALNTARDIGNREDTVLARQNIALLDFARGRWDESLKVFLATLEESRELDNPVIEAVARGNIGRIAMHQGRFDAAGQSLDEAIELLARVQDKRGEAEYSLFKAELLASVGLHAEAAELLDRAATLLAAAGNREQLAMLHRLRGDLAALAGDAAAASRHLDTALARATESGNPVVRLHAELAALRAGQPDDAVAPSRIAELIDATGRIGNVPLQLETLEFAARNALAADEPARAENYCRQWLRLIQAVGSYEGAWRAHQLLAQTGAGGQDESPATGALELARSELSRLRQNMSERQWDSFSRLHQLEETANAS